MTTTVAVWSDIHCPWATVAVHRLRKARDAAGLDAVFDPRAWPLEFVNGSGTPRHIVEPETAVLANHEESLFSRYRGESWPSSFLGAFEVVATARRLFGTRAAEDTDYALRLRFFRHSGDVSMRGQLHQAVGEAGLDADAVMHEWATQPVRADVLDDFERSKDLPIQGSPQVFWPDGSTTHNPGLTDHEWVRGIPRVRTDDAGEPERLLRKHVRD